MSAMRRLASLLAAAVLAGCGASGGGGGDDDGGVRPDVPDAGDTRDTAFFLGEVPDGFTPATVEGKIFEPLDEDWFEIEGAGPGDRIRIELYPPNSKDYDLEVYDTSGNLVEASHHGGDRHETISYANYVGPAFIRVYGVGTEHDDDHTYLLTYIED
jgi:hypothetical protein